MPKFSIIVPVFNVEKYLKRCIDSIEKQTFKDIEIILVDDGSTDNSPQICNQYAKEDKRIKVIHKSNEGVSAARNDGFSLAAGEWVIYCDSDDWMEPNACEILYNTGILYDADVVIADINRVVGANVERKYLFPKEFVFSSIEEKKQLIISTLYPQCCKIATSTIGYGGPWNKAIRKKLLQDNKIYYNVNVSGICDDRLFNANVYANARKIAYVQNPVYNYVFTNNSITQSYKKNVKEINIKIFEAYINLLTTVYDIPETMDGVCFAYGGIVQNAYYSLVIWRLEEAIYQYFFHKKNDKRFHKKIKELGDTIIMEPYKTAAKVVDKSNLSKFQVKIVDGINRGSSYYIWFFYKMRELRHNL